MTHISDAIALIPLRGRHAAGRHAIVDATLPQLAALLECRWYVNDKGYVRTFDLEKPGRVTVKLHQVILDTPPGLIVDHINGNPLDNRLINLRPATSSQNAMNRNRPRGKVPYRGVSLRGERFHAKLRWKDESLHLGDFHTAKDAARVYDLISLLIAGDFARTNFDRERYTHLIEKLRVLIDAERP